MRVAVIGAGVGGLTTAAALAKAGLDVRVFEAQAYVGGCAGTFFRQGYRFDAGATLAGGFDPGGAMDIVARATGVPDWPARPADPAMTVHLPDGTVLPRHGDERRHAARRAAFGAEGEAFWAWQERRADALWELALRRPPFPPDGAAEGLRLLQTGLGWLASDPRRLSPALWADAMRRVSSHLPDAGSPGGRRLRAFVDGQLLISAQVPADGTTALFGAAALDLPRRGVVHLEGGMGAIAGTLAEALRRQGGTLRMKQPAAAIELDRGRAVALRTTRGERVEVDAIVANLPRANVLRLLHPETDAETDAETEARADGALPADGWGAVTVHAGIPSSAVPEGFALHHQVLSGEGLGEGASVFLSLSPAWDAERAPPGQRALTLSTHTRLAPWWRLFREDRAAYEARKAAMGERLLALASRALPGLDAAAAPVFPGTPVTFQRFTGRHRGWVGGFPQTGLLRTRGPALRPGLWLVGDSIFPGQSTAAVALGGLRVADAVLARAGQARYSYDKTVGPSYSRS